MKKLVIALMLISLVGCAGIQTKPPVGCEEAFVWKSGFMPEGRELVELGFASLITAEPKLKPHVKTGALKAWRLVHDGTLGGAVTELLGLVEKNPQYTPLALFALQRLDMDRSLNTCDQEVLLSMFRNIAIYAGATEQDFTASLASLVSPPAVKDK